MAYVLGRVWIEALRIDEANHIFGLRLNIWTCVIVFAFALWYFLTHGGPREQLAVNEDGTVRVITDGAAAEPVADEPGTDDIADEPADDDEPRDEDTDGSEKADAGAKPADPKTP